MRTIIIGAVALGASCAARLKRLDPTHEVVLLEKGNYASFANCGLPYFVGDEIKQQENLLVVDKSVFINRFNIDLRTRSEVIRITPKENKVLILDHDANKTYELEYDNLVLAMGADAITPRIEGVDNPHVHFLKTVDDAVKLKDDMKTAKSIAVVGGGFIGLEAMENLININKEVHLIEGRPSVSTLDYDMALILEDLIRKHGVNLHLNTLVQGIKEDSDGKLIVNTSTGDIKVDEVLLAIGVKPNTKLAVDAGIELDENRIIKVDDNLRTNYKNIYAGGDLVSNYEAISNHLVYIPLANYANKHGRIIANNIKGIESKRQKITMASVFKCFEYTVASVGLGEVMANKFELESDVLYQNGPSHATYYPGATRVHSKLRYSKDGKILGAQMLGQNLVEKRIDVLSSLLLHDATYMDLMEVESCYAPPYGSAKDILNFYGFMIDNTINGGLKSIEPLKLKEIENEVFILDVRDPYSYKLHHIANAYNIPSDQLRQRANELPKNSTIYVYCNVGITSYNAICLLKEYGFKDLVNVSGGYTLYSEMFKN